MFFRNKDCFDREIVVSLHEEAPRSVCGEITRFHRQGRGSGSFVQTFALGLRQIAHLVETSQAAVLKRREDLPAAIRGLAVLCNKANEFSLTQPG